MKLGSNRKSIGMGAGYREFSYDNKRVMQVFNIVKLLAKELTL